MDQKRTAGAPGEQTPKRQIAALAGDFDLLHALMTARVLDHRRRILRRLRGQQKPGERRHLTLSSQTSESWQPRPAPPAPSGLNHSSVSVPPAVASAGTSNSTGRIGMGFSM